MSDETLLSDETQTRLIVYVILLVQALALDRWGVLCAFILGLWLGVLFKREHKREKP